jgi:hypothetical protein
MCGYRIYDGDGEVAQPVPSATPALAAGGTRPVPNVFEFR